MTTEYQTAVWDLSELFSSPQAPEIEETITRIDQKSQHFERFREKLEPIPDFDLFKSMIEELEEITWLAHGLHAYPDLKFSENTQDQNTQALMARLDQFMAVVQNRLLFFDLWWKQVDREEAEQLMDQAGDHRYWLESIRRFSPHTLTEAEEKLINIKDVTGSSAFITLYDTITNRYVFEIEIHGEKKHLTRGELMVYAQHHDQTLRAAAYQKLYEVYGQDAPILGQVYQNLVRDWKSEQVDLRRHRTPISVRNLSNDLPDPVVETLLEVCRQNVDLFQRFFTIKAKRLGLDRLTRYDLYAPVVKSDKTYGFGQASGMVLEAFGQFDATTARLAEEVFSKRHLDSEIRPGKRDGAFCATVTPDLVPWVLVNYQGRPRDIATLAHELGHAVHSMLARDHSIFTFHATLPLAETASTFGEMLLVDYLLGRETDENVRLDLLFRQVDDAYATIMRQAFFAFFEVKAHDLTLKGATINDLGNAYLEDLQAQFGTAVDVADEFRWEWVSIPHFFHTPFYVYAYAFGQLLVLSLYRQYQEEGEAFVPRYKAILAAGGSDAPQRILAKAGLDIAQPSFWQGGFDVVKGLVDRLAELA